MSCLEGGQRVIFEIQRDERTGGVSAIALTLLEFEFYETICHPESSSNRQDATFR